MYSVSFNNQEAWVTYTSNLSIDEAIQIARMLGELGYEVRIDEHTNGLKEVDYLIGAVHVLEQEQATSRDLEASERLLRMQGELVQALLRERSGEIRFITPPPADMPAALD